METYTDPALLDLQGTIAALPLSGQIKSHQPAVISKQPSQLVPASHQQSPNELHFEQPAKLKDSSPDQTRLAVKSCSDNRKASLSVAANEALKERVKGIEPSPEAWENYAGHVCRSHEMLEDLNFYSLFLRFKPCNTLQRNAPISIVRRRKWV